MIQANRLVALSAILLLLSSPSQVSAKPKPLELKWSELAAVIARQNVELVVPGGAKIKGEAITVREDTLVMDVKKTSDPKAYPKGSASIPRASVTTLAFERKHGSWGRALGTTVGVLTGVTAGAYTAISVADSAGTGVAVFLAIAVGITMVGYYLGGQLDRKVTEIRIVP